MQNPRPHPPYCGNVIVSIANISEVCENMSKQCTGDFSLLLGFFTTLIRINQRPRNLGTAIIMLTDHIFVKFGNISDSNNYTFLQYGGHDHGFCIALEISPSRTISGWVIGQFRQHHIF
jgi:hypothetical protein